jgi:uncharacterized membrane protein
MPEPQPSSRLPALDWMRGIVMILMVWDHAGAIFDSGHLFSDSAAMYQPGSPLPWNHFLARFVTHLCAPTFLFLAGTSLALSIERRRAAGAQASVLDRNILIRGLLIAGLDPTLVTVTWALIQPLMVIFQVLYAIGVSFLCMIPLRRLPARWLVVLGAGFFLVSEAITVPVWDVQAWSTSLPFGFLLAVGKYGPIVVVYPLLPWLAMMMIGWGLGRTLLRYGAEGRSPVRLLAGSGAAALIAFAVVRGLNGYGNMLLLREDSGWVQWLHVSKYPPSFTFTALMLGIMAWMLAALFRYQERSTRPRWTNNPVLVFGQTALFFYIVHIPLLVAIVLLSGRGHALRLPGTFLITLLALLLLYPVCRLYRGYKMTHRDGWTRFL